VTPGWSAAKGGIGFRDFLFHVGGKISLRVNHVAPYLK